MANSLLRVRQTKILAQLGKLFSVRVLAIGLSFVQTLILTEFFGIEVFGQLSFALSAATLAMLALSMGLDQVLMRNIARHGLDKVRQHEEWGPLRSWIRHVTFPVTLVVAACGVAVFSMTEWGGAYTVPLVAVLVVLPVTVARKYVESLLLGVKRATASIVASQVSQPMLIILGVGLLWVLNAGRTVQSASALYVLAVVGSFGFALWLARPTLSALNKTERQPYSGTLREGKPVAISGWHFALVALGFVAGQNIDVLVIGLLAEPEQVALVRVATRVAEMAGLIRVIALIQFKPSLAEAYGKSDHTSLQKQVGTLTAIFSVSGVAITALLWIFAEDIMRLFGEDFVAGAWLLRIYSLGILITMLCGPCNVLLAMCNQERAASRILVVALAVNLLLDLTLIPWLGALGCAIANMTSLSLLAGLSTWTSWRRLQIDTSVVGLVRRGRSRRKLEA